MWGRRGALGLWIVACGCWRANPAFLVGLEEGTTTGPGGDSSGESGMSSGTDTTGGGDTTGGPGTSASGTTAVEPGTSTGDPSSTGGGPGTSMTGTSTSGASTGDDTTGGPIDEAALCHDALDGLVMLGPPIVDMPAKLCTISMWTGSDTQNPNVVSPATCGAPSLAGFAVSKGAIAVNPPMMFGPSLVTGTQSLPSRTGTIEGVFPGIDLAGAVHPCFLARVACIADQPGPCALDVQVFIKSAEGAEWGAPVAEATVTNQAAYPLALPLADYVGQPIDILLVVANDGLGAAQEVVAWERSWIVEASP